MMEPIYYKYPRTFHLPWSPGATSDDKILQSTDHFEGKRVIITEKMDGENSTIAYKKIYARSINSKDHESRHWLKANYRYICDIIDPKNRICVENVYAKHSIYYDNLDSYIYGLSTWHLSTCLPWDKTIEIFDKYSIITPEIIYDGIWNEDYVRDIRLNVVKKEEMEGYVVRVADEFELDDFKFNVAKFVRSNHVNTEDHWLYKQIIPNKLKKIV